MKNKNEPLKIGVINGELIISVGVDTLAYAVENESAWIGYQIMNTEGFAKNILQVIIKQNNGQSLITDMFNSAAKEMKNSSIKDEKYQWWAYKLDGDKDNKMAMITKVG
jgi:hypothetical protein